MVKEADSKSAGVTRTGSNPVADVFLLIKHTNIRTIASRTDERIHLMEILRGLGDWGNVTDD